MSFWSCYFVAGMSAGSVINNAAYLPALFGTALPVALPLAIALLAKGGLLAIEMDAALITFMAVVIMVGYSTNRWIGDLGRLRFERDALVAGMRRSAAGLKQEIAGRCQHEADLTTGDPGAERKDQDPWPAERNGLGLALANYRLREQLRTMSLRDTLTSLYNRRYFEEAIEVELPRAASTDSSVCVIMGDVDHFKAINDSFGHDAGDAALRALGQALAKAVRPGDIACRYGGEEFVIVLTGTSLQQARERAEAIRQPVQNTTVSLHGQLIGPLTMSFGVAVAPDLADTAGALVANADRAMYIAKHQGRNRVVLAGRTEAPTDTAEPGAACHNEQCAATSPLALVA